MYRFLIVLTVAGLLAACTDQGGGSSGQPVDSAASTGAAASAGASAGSPGSAGTASTACGEAFGPLADMDVTSVSELGDMPNEVQPTIEACESVSDWVAGAQGVVENEIDPDTAVFLLRINCEDLSLARSAICEELASS